MVRRQRWWTVVKLAEIRPSQPTAGQFDDTSTDLKSALLRLSPEERLPLVLHFYLDLPLDEVARTLGLSPAAAKSRIYRTARKLRADLTLEEVF
jgi:RNA polymerase sigma-70 factor (ECF subfamily)